MVITYISNEKSGIQRKNMSRTKLVPEVFLDTFLYTREARVAFAASRLFHAEKNKLRKNLCVQVVSNLTRYYNLT